MFIEMPKEEEQTSPESKRGSSCSTAQLSKGMDNPGSISVLTFLNISNKHLDKMMFHTFDSIIDRF